MLMFRRTNKAARIGTCGIGLIMLVTCIMFVRNAFGLVVLVLMGLGFTVAGWYLPPFWIGELYALIAATVVYWFVYLPIGLNFSNPFGAAGIGVIVGMLTMYIVTIATTEAPKESGLDIKQKPSTRSGKNV